MREYAGKVAVLVVLAGLAMWSAGCEAAEEGTPEVGRTIAVATTSDLVFDPATIQTDVGETVRFDIENTSEVTHTFSVAGSYERAEVLEDVELAPGESQEVVMDLPDGQIGLFLYCRYHEEQGMVGAIGVGIEPDVPTPGAVEGLYE